MHCCGTRAQVIELRGGSEPLRMVRCTTCGARQWHVGDEQVAVDAAFELLASTYRAVPRAARAARARVAGVSAARAAVRAAAAAPPAPAAPAGVDRDELAGLLQGWAVLGATG